MEAVKTATDAGGNTILDSEQTKKLQMKNHLNNSIQLSLLNKLRRKRHPSYHRAVEVQQEDQLLRSVSNTKQYKCLNVTSGQINSQSCLCVKHPPFFLQIGLKRHTNDVMLDASKRPVVNKQ